MTGRRSRPVLAFALASLVGACGGTAVIDPPGAGGAGGADGSGGATSSSTTSSTSSGPSGCTSHEQCLDDEVCLFATGQCVPPCEGACDSCGPGFVCDDCASSSCPACADCVAACRPVSDGECDDDDTCLDGAQACVFVINYCVTECGPGNSCPSSSVCEPCATSSCCGCDDCVPVCVPI